MFYFSSNFVSLTNVCSHVKNSKLSMGRHFMWPIYYLRACSWHNGMPLCYANQKIKKFHWMKTRMPWANLAKREEIFHITSCHKLFYIILHRVFKHPVCFVDIVTTNCSQIETLFYENCTFKHIDSICNTRF